MKRHSLFVASLLLPLVLLPPGFAAETQPSRTALVGKWSGRLSSVNYASFAVTIDVPADGRARLVGEGSPCFAEADLVVTIRKPNAVTLAGTSKAGESITLKGTLDDSGKQLDLTYIANGSSSARCETDQGAGLLDKE